MLEMLLYVSRSTLSEAESEAAVPEIAVASRPRNRRAGITGGLIFTGVHFAQVLEGEPAALEALLARIASDPRHTDLTIVERRPILARGFERWDMAYSGPSFYMDRHVRPLLTGQGGGRLSREDAARKLTELTRQFVALRDAA